jgi:hypothetical protein
MGIIPTKIIGKGQKGNQCEKEIICFDSCVLHTFSAAYGLQK